MGITTKIILGLVGLLGTVAAANSGELRVRDVQLIACTPVGMPDGKRVLQRFAPDAEACRFINTATLVYIAEFGNINALCTRKGDDGCTPLDEMNDAERAHFEYMRGFIRVKDVYRTCVVRGVDADGRVLWQTEMMTVNDDCKPSVNAHRHWDFIQKKVYLRDGEDTLGVISIR